MLTRRDDRDDVVRASDPVRSVQALEERLARLLPEWTSFPTLFPHDSRSEFVPLADVEETDDAYIIEVELPGISRNDIEVDLAGRTLTIAGERKERERVGILRRRTRVTGRFRYEVTLPAVEPDAEVAAGYDDGVLTVRIPKPETTRPRRIPIR